MTRDDPPATALRRVDAQIETARQRRAAKQAEAERQRHIDAQKSDRYVRSPEKSREYDMKHRAKMREERLARRVDDLR